MRIKEFKFKVGDIFLIVALMIFCISPFLYFRYLDVQGKDFLYLSVQVKGKEVKKIKLTGNTKTIRVPIEQGGRVKNIFEIRGEVVDMIEAECPDQLCVLHNPISKPGETIVCLPNKVVLEIKGGTGTNDTQGDMSTY